MSFSFLRAGWEWCKKHPLIATLLVIIALLVPPLAALYSLAVLTLDALMLFLGLGEKSRAAALKAIAAVGGALARYETVVTFLVGLVFAGPAPVLAFFWMIYTFAGWFRPSNIEIRAPVAAPAPDPTPDKPIDLHELYRRLSNQIFS